MAMSGVLGSVKDKSKNITNILFVILTLLVILTLPDIFFEDVRSVIDRSKYLTGHLSEAK